MTPTPFSCETEVISKFIRIVTAAIECSFPDNSTYLLGQEEQIFARKILDIFKTQNGTFSPLSENETLSEPILGTGAKISNSIGGGGDGTKPVHRLQNLEMIKVVVLIIVISIIMLTTCRMVFQLFIRFRPEKPQD